MTRHTPKKLRYSVLVNMIGLVLSMLMSAPIALAQEQPFTVEIDLTGATLDRSGFVTVTGTFTCTEPAQVNQLSVTVNQPVGRTDSVYGAAGLQDVPCDSTPSTFSLEVFPAVGTGRFLPGQAFIEVFIYAYTLDFARSDSDRITVSKRLRY